MKHRELEEEKEEEEGDREMEEIYIIYGMGQSKPRIQRYQSESYCDPWGNLAAILTHFTIPFVT